MSNTVALILAVLLIGWRSWLIEDVGLSPMIVHAAVFAACWWLARLAFMVDEMEKKQ